MSILQALLQRDAAQKIAERNRAMTMLRLRAQMDARAVAAWDAYGDRYAGMDPFGRVIVWGKTGIPKTRPPATQEDTHG